MVNVVSGTGRSVRTICALLAAVCFVCAAQTGGNQKSDLKIESHWETSWDSGSTTTYVKGDFMRYDDCSDADHRPCANADEGGISDCGVWAVERFPEGFYELNADGTIPPDFTAPEKTGPGVVRVILESVDTGERKPMVGYAARHIVTKAKYDLSNATCSVNETFHTYDGWYIDPPYQNKCSTPGDGQHKGDFFFISQCDKVVVETTGPPLGYALREDEEYGRGDNKHGSIRTVDAISHENLDPSLFERPAARPFAELRHPGRPAKQTEPQPANAPQK